MKKYILWILFVAFVILTWNIPNYKVEISKFFISIFYLKWKRYLFGCVGT